MPTTLTAHEKPISRIFSNEYVFRIPSYQRPYAWKTEQAADLFDDLVEFMGQSNGAVADMPPYFLGSTVLIKDENSPNADVVDGQQRLTTLTLLLAAIRAHVDAKNAGDIASLICERGSTILGTQDRFRLSLRERDAEFFRQYVQMEDGFAKLIGLDDLASDSRKNLRDNARLFDERLQALPERTRVKLAQFIVTRCFLVVVATPDLDSAYRIFSVLNSRGLDLSATDILKADIIGGVPTGQRDAYTRRWEDCEDDLGREDFGELFSHIRMVYRKAKPQGTLLKEFREHVTKGLEAPTFIDTVLLPMADVYGQLTMATYASASRADEVNEALKWLNRLEFTDWVPPALAYSVRKRNTPSDMVQFFADLERLAYALLIRRGGINERIDRFSRLTKAIEASEDLWADASPLQLGQSEQSEVYDALNGPVYESISARARSTVLLRLDSLMSGGGATYDYDTVTVEHVLPQTPADGSLWIQWFPEEPGRISVVHRLGNLALLTRKKNSAASNYEFDRKKTVYFAKDGVSPFVLTTQVLQHQTWTPEIVAARQKQLMDRLEQHWRLQGRKRPDTADIPNNGDTLDGTWRDDVKAALERLGGRAPLGEIYRVTRQIRQEEGRSVPATIEATVRQVLEAHSSDSGSYRAGRPDLFWMPEGRGRGIWGLR
jgi:hypothetical protein